MLKIVSTNKFKRDIKVAKRRGFDIGLLKDVVTKLANREILDQKHKDHPLIGNYAGFRECHIKPDWILIYLVDEDELELLLFRNGTHSDLF